MRRFIEAARALENCPLFIDDTPALPISTIAARARRLKRQHGLDALFIDYLQLARPASSRSEGRVQEVSEITQGLKAIAKELNIPVIALSQLSRQVESREDKRPQLSDLRESGSIEQDADVVMFVFREEYYSEREKPGDHDIEAMMKWKDAMGALHGKAEVIIGKQRHGPIGTVDLAFEGEFTRFSNLVQAYQQGAPPTSPDAASQKWPTRQRLRKHRHAEPHPERREAPGHRHRRPPRQQLPGQESGQWHRVHGVRAEEVRHPEIAHDPRPAHHRQPAGVAPSPARPGGRPSCS